MPSPAKPPKKRSRALVPQAKHEPVTGGARCRRLQKVISMMAAPGYIAASFLVRPPRCTEHPFTKAAVLHLPPHLVAAALQRHRR